MAEIATARELELSKKQICRFCLTQQNKLSSIYMENARIKSTATLPLQIMAITSIEVSNDDGMPGFICLDCRLLFEHCYRFKQMCKRAETLLRQFPLTGVWPARLEKPRAPLISSQSQKDAAAAQPKKLLNSLVSSSNITIENVEVMETCALPKPKPKTNPPPKPIPSPTLSLRAAYQVKVENNQELSMDDVHNLIAELEEEETATNRPTTPTPITKSPTVVESSPSPARKVLNKSSMRILNKGAASDTEPRLATPHLKRDGDGNMAIVTEILEPQTTENAEDAVKNAAPVATNVFPCPDCERSFPLEQLLDIHRLNHARKRSFQCPECDKSFFSKYDLQKHNFIHTGEKPFKCSVCVKAFTRRALLHRHERIHTDIPKFICVYCEKPFISRQEMEKHAERHTKRRPFKCSECGKSFAFKQGLERHEVVHSKNLPFSCQHCNRSFITACKLARHLVAHAGKRAFPCKYCPKSYILSHHLSRHLRVHNQGQGASFVCNICRECLQTYDSLVDHSTEHAKESLSCPLCKENTPNPEAVTKHMQAHKDNERFACEFCDHIFLQQSKLQKHIEDDHVVDMVPYQNEGEINLVDDDDDDVEEVDVDEVVETEMLQKLLGEENLPEKSSNSSPPAAKKRKLSPIKAKKPQEVKRQTRKRDDPQTSLEKTKQKVKDTRKTPEAATKQGRTSTRNGKAAVPLKNRSHK